MSEKMLHCEDESLIAMLDGELTGGAHELALSHLDTCSTCQLRLEELVATQEEWKRTASILTDSALESNDVADPDLPSPWPAETAWTEAMIKELVAPPVHPEMLGRLGRYDIERLIGSGGMGLVFKAYDGELSRPVAIKLLAPHLAASGAARQRFAREAKAAAAVVNQHVVPIHNVETERESPFIVMGFVSGESLQERIDREGALELRAILRIGLQVADGLAAAHQQGLVHRDIKPSNILLKEDVDRALISDFGLARATDDVSLTRTGFHPGTPRYMSPEQAAGKAVDSRSDLFSFGSMLYTMCTGTPAFQAESSLGVMRCISDSEPKPVRESNPEIPDWLCSVISKLMAKQPHERYQSAKEVGELLSKCLSHVQQPLENPLPVEVQCQQAGRSWFKRRTFAIAGCVMIALLLVLAILYVPNQDGEKTQRRRAKPPISLFEITVNGKQGFINNKGQIVIQPKYQKVYPFTEGLAAVMVDDKWGFINKAGKTVIEPQFKEVALFSSGRSRVRINEYTDPFGYIDAAGNVVIKPQYDCALDFQNGVARVGKEKITSKLFSRFADIGIDCDYHYIDINGQTVPKPRPEFYAKGKPDELIRFRENELIGYVDVKGKVVIEPQFVSAGEFSEGLAHACKDKLFGYIDRSGEFVIPPSFAYCNKFSAGLAGVQLEEGAWGFIDQEGDVVLPANYNWVYGGFRDGLAQVTVAGRLGYINKRGEWVW